MSSKTAYNKLRTMVKPSNSLYSVIKSMAHQTVDPIQPNYDTQVSKEIFTSGWERIEAATPNFSLSATVPFDLRAVEGLVGEFYIDVELPDQYDPGTGLEDIQYAPLPALSMIDHINIKLASNKIHTFYPKELFQLISMENTPEYRKFLSKETLGGYCVTGGNQYVTRPGRVRIPIVMVGSSLEYGKCLWNQYTPFPLNRVRDHMRVEVKMTSPDRFSNAGQNAKPLAMNLVFKEYTQASDNGNPYTVGQEQARMAETNIPSREFLSFDLDNISFRNDAIANIPITTVRDNAELLTILLHITDVNEDNPTQRKYFDFEEIESLEVRVASDAIYKCDTATDFKFYNLSHYRIDTRVIGSTAPASESTEDAKYMVQIPIAEHDYKYRDSVGQGTNPLNRALTLRIKTKNNFTGRIQVSAIYRAILTINGIGNVSLNKLKSDMI